MTDDWRAAQEQAFSVLIGRPLTDFAGSYGLYYNCGDLTLEFLRAKFDVGLFARGELVGPPFDALPALGESLAGWDGIAPAWTIDFGRSVFSIADEGDAAAIGLPELESPITGAELGPILVERGLRPRDVRKAWPDIDFRVHTDGTLFDALSAATGTLRGPGGLFELSPAHGVDPERDAVLKAVEHEGLRNHLRHLSRTEESARSDGGCYRGAEDPGLAIPRPVVAAWEFGESQFWSAVVRLP